MSAMAYSGHQCKVARIIVCLVLVYVVNDFACGETPSKDSFRNHNVFELVSTAVTAGGIWNEHSHVAANSDIPTAFPVMVQRSGLSVDWLAASMLIFNPARA